MGDGDIKRLTAASISLWVFFAFDDKIKCGFLVDGGCAIYEDRPDICRKYGIIKELPCPFLRQDGTKRPLWEKQLIFVEQDIKLKEFMKFAEKIRVDS